MSIIETNVTKTALYPGALGLRGVPNRFAENPTKIPIRVKEVEGLLGRFVRGGKVTRQQLAGNVIDLFSYVGTVSSAIRPYGGMLTVVEKNSEYLNLGVKKGLIVPGADRIVNKPVEEFLASDPDANALADVITCFGTADFYFDNKYMFMTNVRRWLKPDGVLIMTGAEDMKRPFEDFAQLFGGESKRLIAHSFTWDAYSYYSNRRNHPHVL